MVTKAREKEAIPLNCSTAGQAMRIQSLPKGNVRAQFIRFGIHEGEKIHCYERLTGGTIVIRKNRQQIAVGHRLAKEIMVVVLRDGEA